MSVKEAEKRCRIIHKWATQYKEHTFSGECFYLADGTVRTKKFSDPESYILWHPSAGMDVIEAVMAKAANKVLNKLPNEVDLQEACLEVTEAENDTGDWRLRTYIPKRSDGDFRIEVAHDKHGSDTGELHVMVSINHRGGSHLQCEIVGDTTWVNNRAKEITYLLLV